MPTYSTNLGLTLQTTGENPGTWGDVTNVNLGTFLEQSVTGYQALTFASADITITLVDGTSATAGNNYARNMYFYCTGTLGAARNLIVPNRKKLYIVRHAADNFPITVKTSAGTGLAVPQNGTMIVYCDGTNVVSAADYFPVFSAAAINNTPIGSTTASTGAFTTVTASTSFNGPIGAGTPAAGSFTNVNVTDVTLPAVGLYRSTTNTLAFSTASTTRGNIGSAGAWTIAAPTSGNHVVNLLSGSNGIAFTTGSATFNIWYDGSTYYQVGTTTAAPLKFLVNNSSVLTLLSGGGATIPAISAGSGPGLVVNGAAYTPSVNVTGVASTTLNPNASNVFNLNLQSGVNVGTFTVTNTPLFDGQTITIFIIQPGSGTAATLAWPSTFKWAGGVVPTISNTLGAIDMVVATYRTATGLWYASIAKAFA